MKSKDMREKIISAAVKVFTRRGFFETRVEDIARCAGIAKGTVYLYFKDKPSLYAGVVDEQFRGAIAMLKQTVDDDISPAKKLETIAEKWMNYMLKFRGGFGMEMLGNVNLTSRIMKAIHRQASERVNEIAALVSHIISEGINKGEFVRTDPRIGAYFFLNAVRAALSIQLFVPGAKGGEKEVIKIMMEGLRKR